jgi:hypothetical protein
VPRLLLALSALVALGFAAGCPALLAPAPGAGAGQACAASWMCAEGLACECGQCTEPTGRAVRCPAVADECSDTPSSCYATCGDTTVIGPAGCVDGRESCAEVGGVLRRQCSTDICWGEPAPGELCVGSSFVCEFGRSAATGLCYTFECDAETQGSCVSGCGGPHPFAEVCLAGEWRCESGIPTASCGECVGPPPPCVRSCDDLREVGPAACQSLTWSCSHFSLPDAGPLASERSCCAAGAELREPADLEALADVRCVTGVLAIRTGSLTEVELPGLTRVDDLVVSSDVVARVSLPALVEVVRGLAVENNAALTTFEAPALTRVGIGLSFLDNPALPTCDIDDLLVQVSEGGGVALVNIAGNASCPGADGGEPAADDGGSAPEPGPSPAEDAGEADGGALDAGPADGAE